MLFGKDCNGLSAPDGHMKNEKWAWNPVLSQIRFFNQRILIRHMKIYIFLIDLSVTSYIK